MTKTTVYRMMFTRDRGFNLGDPLPSGLRDDQGARLPASGRCMIDSILHLETLGHYILSVSHYSS